MKIIETKYKGYRFRSRLEARWAVFFDELGIEWEYEPEGFDLGDGTYYLPDFRLPCYGLRYYDRPKTVYTDNELIEIKMPIDLYVEIKGHMTPESANKIEKFAEHESILLLGNIPEETEHICLKGSNEFIDGTNLAFANLVTVDGDFYPAYPLATDDGHFYLGGPDYWEYWREDQPRSARAFAKARQYRFGGAYEN